MKYIIPSEIIKLEHEDISNRPDCNLCQEVELKVGSTTPYGAIVIAKIGSTENDALFATLSPQTGGNPAEDFTIQIMTKAHLTHFSQLHLYPQLAQNYGLLLAKVSHAMSVLIAENSQYKAIAATRNEGIALAMYGKCTTWKEKKEHFHIKLYQFRNVLSQPSVVDSTFEKKAVLKDAQGEYVRMDPVRKQKIEKSRLNDLAHNLITLLQISAMNTEQEQ